MYISEADTYNTHRNIVSSSEQLRNSEHLFWEAVIFIPILQKQKEKIL